MNEKSIGVMDSGLGGLTCVKELNRLLPNEDICYFGDTERSPYGILTPNTIIKYSAQISSFLVNQNIKVLVIACGTSSGVAAETLRKMYNIPIIDVIAPSCSEAVSSTVNKKIGIIGTATTIKKGMYEAYIRKIMPEAELFSLACQGFVELVESGHFDPEDWKVKMAVEKYLYDLKYKNIDTLILGCTHFPILASAISRFMGKKVKLISSGGAVAGETAKYLESHDMLNSENHTRRESFFTTGSSDVFRSLGTTVLGREISGDVTSVQKSYLDQQFPFKRVDFISK